MHAVALAGELGIRKVVDPARRRRVLGVGDADERPPPRLLPDPPGRPDAPANADRLERASTSSTGAALEQFAREGIAAGQVGFRRHGKLRYANQEHGVEIELPDGPIDAAAVEAIEASFHDAYEREYTYRLDAPVEFVGGHLVAVAEVGKLAPARLPVTGRPLEQASKGERHVDFATEGIHAAAIYDGELLEPGMRVRRAGDRRDEGHDDGRAPRQPGVRRRLRQPRHLARAAGHDGGDRRRSRSRSRSSRARCRRRATRCSPRSARRR